MDNKKAVITKITVRKIANRPVSEMCSEGPERQLADRIVEYGLHQLHFQFSPK
jgi:hypothetical protein